MKVIILAGGLGTRARPFTDYSPKPMIPIDDRPTIDHILRYISNFPEIDQIIIVSNFENGHGNQIKSYFEGKESTLKKKINYVEDKLEGTGGALLRTKQFLKGEEDFVVWFSDNLCAIDLRDMMRFHKENGGIGCIGVRKKKIEETGFVMVDDNGLIIEFSEKPLVELKDPECLGIYIFNKRILDYISKEIEKKKSVNLSFDVLQKLPSHEKLFAFDIKDLPWIDVESPARINRNIDYVRKIIKQMESV